MIEDEIKSAWNSYKAEAVSTNSMAISADVFRAGYVAAIFHEWEEVPVGKRRHRATYRCLLSDGSSRRLMYFSENSSYWDDYNESSVDPSDVRAVFRAREPHCFDDVFSLWRETFKCNEKYSVEAT